MNKKLTASVCLFFLFALLLMVAEPVLGGQTWMTWNTRSGLPSNNLSCLAIKKGMMAVGSDKGIGLYLDNYTGWFNLASYNPALADVAVRSIDFDDYGTLWAATPGGLLAVGLERFPEVVPEVRKYDHQNGLSTVDVEVVQVCDNKIYVGCFGGWLFVSEISPGSGVSSFMPVNSANLGSEDVNKFLSVGITALAMDYPGGGIYSTKGSGLLRAADGSNLVGSDELFSDWVNDFWAFSEGNYNRIIAVTQNQMNLISNNQSVGRCTLPTEDCWISCVTTAPDEETDEYKREKPKGYLHLETFLGKRILYAGTRGNGLWIFNDGRWSNLTTRDSPLPSDNINKVYYLPGPKKLAILSDGGLTMLGISDDYQFDIFRASGSDPYWAKTFWPFLQSWGPYVFGNPYHKAYPIEPYIAYGKMQRGKDLWLAHDRGLSRFVFPVAPFIGVMQYRFQLAGRFETKANDPFKNLQIEDNSMVGDRPPTGPGEELWHHYCKEQPTDICVAPITEIYVSLDMKTMAGPENEVLVYVSSLDEITPEAAAGALRESQAGSAEDASDGETGGETDDESDDATGDSAGTATETATDAATDDTTDDIASGTNERTASGYPPVPVFVIGCDRFDARGHQLFSVASLMQECPLHSIPSENISDIVLDLSERVWTIFDGNVLACLDNRVGETVPDPANNDWYEFSSGQLPWEKSEKLLCVQRVGSAIYVSAENTGVYYLPAAHGAILNDLRSSDWQRIELPEDSEEPDQFKNIEAIEYWKTEKGAVAAMMHKKGLATFDGTSLTFVSVPERNYTCMVQDRNYNLWLGSLEGLLYLTPAGTIHEINAKMNDFNNEKVVCMAAAPDNAKYPYVIAVAVDNQAREQSGSLKHYKTSDVPPFIGKSRDNPYRMRVGNADVSVSQIMLYDGEKWEPMFRPGVMAMMFDQSFLWISTSCRVMRLYMPTVVQSY